jgi:hypothetical protein
VRGRPHVPAQGRAVQVAPIRPKLKAPGTKRLKLTHDLPLSNFAFKFNLRRYSKEVTFVGGKQRVRCACFSDFGFSDARQLYDGCDAAATKCKT